MQQKTIKRGNWFEIYDGPCFTLARRLPARFDISREISMPLMSAPRLARQIRQDIWRKLQSIRGFLPVVIDNRHAMALITEQFRYRHSNRTGTQHNNIHNHAIRK